MSEGKLEKLIITAFKKADYSDDKSEQETFEAMINPETYSLDYKIEFQAGQPEGSSGTQQKFTVKQPEEFSFEILLDSTGLIGKKNVDTDGSIEGDLTKLRNMLLLYDGDIHEPKHIIITWGSLVFKGRCTSLNITMKLFSPSGLPIRAICKIALKESIEDNLRAAKEKKKSPDLTHYRTVQDGDTLPLMCFRIYGSSSYYPEVARINRLSDFRNLKAGMQLQFPPLEKNSAVS